MDQSTQSYDNESVQSSSSIELVTNIDSESSQSVASETASESSCKHRSINVTPKQNDIAAEISLLQSDLIGLYKRRDTNMLSVDQANDLKQKQKRLDLLQLDLKRLNQERQMNYRKQARIRREDLVEEYPVLKKKLKLRDSAGKPRLEIDQPQLLQTIVDIATYGSAAHNRRQNEVLRSIRTLNQLVSELRTQGFSVSRNGVYLRLLPRSSKSIEGMKLVCLNLLNSSYFCPFFHLKEGRM